ncbi:MAG TPA: hypothetical protein VET82_10365 [Candidatus Eisenbacteria bacterium]|nr:hypothetical protein [Candidatus Eisenbacteria bacterium]
MPMDQPLDPAVLADVERDLRTELERTQAEMARLTREHERAGLLKRIYEHDPITRERFTLLHENIDAYPGKMAGLREEERLLSGWLARCQALRRDAA